ncbi:hypothetical protein PHISCL_03396 [Aspergillus sclerotialis]|uniref:Uncharacterized protein n=1 Tax=Aspergillus sclerotialis TaxID=2070753 RepID=A0A3A2ZSC5_9EURO|nr:hypothetical protein PHISCL_03396 [Aspergillus sclerotialis]
MSVLKRKEENEFYQRTAASFGNLKETRVCANWRETASMLVERRINFRPLATPPDCNFPSMEICSHSNAGYKVDGLRGKRSTWITQMSSVIRRRHKEIGGTWSKYLAH